jgi:nitroreductase
MLLRDFKKVWLERYGAKPDFDYPYLTSFLNHCSIRGFSEKPVADDILEALIGVAHSASTSSNLQLRTIVSVQDPDRKAEIARLCDNQKQILEAPCFLVFCADLYRMERISTKAGENPSALDYTEFLIMATIDASIAAERLVCAAESMGLGVCYIGALRDHSEKVSHFLEFPEKVFGLFGLCLGWPNESRQPRIRPRMSLSTIWHKEAYSEENEIEEYDKRMEVFDSASHRKAIPWSVRSGKRVNAASLHERSTIFQYLQKIGIGHK